MGGTGLLEVLVPAAVVSAGKLSCDLLRLDEAARVPPPKGINLALESRPRDGTMG